MNGDLTAVSNINSWASSKEYNEFVKGHKAQGRAIAKSNAAHKLPRVAPKTVYAQGRQVTLA